ncbi:MAG: DNA-binding protein [Candidatus Obscuribacterales bacterium]|nr:DNA-binding protein [Candidatus Obscuribacterales bacterium]
MGRRGSITEAQVFEAADTLVAQGREVTPNALLNILGSGSFSTIYKHLDTWEKSRATAVTDRAAVVPDSVLAAFGAAWRTATAEAGKEVIAVREQATEEIAEARAKFQEALGTIERLEAESEADAAKLDELAAKSADLEKALNRSENEKSGLKATTEQLRQQVQAQETELARLHKDGEAERKRHQDELTKAASAQEKLALQLEQVRQQLSEAHSKLEKSERERSEALLKAQEASQRATRAEEQSQKAEKETAAARKEKEAAIKEAAELKGKADALQSQNADLIARLADRDKEDKPKNR